MTYERALSIFRQNIPDATFRPQPSSDWAGFEPLPAEIAAYYQLLGPVDVEVTHFENTILLPPLKDLWIYQEPFQFDVTPWKRDKTWKDGYFYIVNIETIEYDHLVFESGTGQIHKVIYTENGWTPRPLFHDLESMALVLAILSTPVPINLAHSDDNEQEQENYFDHIKTQLQEILSYQEMITIVTELKWQYTIKLI